MKKRVGFIGIIIEKREGVVDRVNSIISDFGETVVSRMGVPYREKGVSVITIVVDTDSDTMGAFTGRLGSIEGVTIKSALMKS